MLLTRPQHGLPPRLPARAWCGLLLACVSPARGKHPSARPATTAARRRQAASPSGADPGTSPLRAQGCSAGAQSPGVRAPPRPGGGLGFHAHTKRYWQETAPPVGVCIARGRGAPENPQPCSTKLVPSKYLAKRPLKFALTFKNTAKIGTQPSRPCLRLRKSCEYFPEWQHSARKLSGKRELITRASEGEEMNGKSGLFLPTMVLLVHRVIRLIDRFAYQGNTVSTDKTSRWLKNPEMLRTNRDRT